MMLKYNVVNAEMFCYIHAFNKSTWEEELDFLLGTEDKIFMMSCNPSLRGNFTGQNIAIICQALSNVFAIKGLI